MSMRECVRVWALTCYGAGFTKQRGVSFSPEPDKPLLVVDVVSAEMWGGCRLRTEGEQDTAHIPSKRDARWIFSFPGPL